MGGYGSGCGGFKRQGYLRPGWSGMVHWSRRVERFASVSFDVGNAIGVSTFLAGDLVVHLEEAKRLRSELTN